MTITIENCRLGYDCEMVWDNLVPIKQPSIRWCTKCQTEVHLCITDGEFLAATLAGHCVAFQQADDLSRKNLLTPIPKPPMPPAAIAADSYMSKSQKAYFRNLIQDWWASLQHPASDEKQFERNHRKKLLQRLQSTLKRIETSDYGFCTACNGQIGLLRLSSRPHAELCLDCQERKEFSEKKLRSESGN